MKKIILILICFLTIVNLVHAQEVSVRIVQSSYSSVDPDGAGPATGSVVIRFEIMSSLGTLFGDGIGLGFVFQSSALMATPTNTSTTLGPLSTNPGWVQGADNRPGNPVSVSYGGRTFDRRMIISYNQSGGLSNAPIGTSWTPVAQVTYWTLGNIPPEGGYATPEAGSLVPQYSLSTEGGFTEYPFLSPNLNAPIALTSVVLPVTFTKLKATCTSNGALINWTTASESNSSYFLLESSVNGVTWSTVSKIPAAGQSTGEKNYQQLDLSTKGNTMYRIKQVDIDGQFSYTDIVRSNCATSDITSLIYPVPARDRLNIVIKSDKNFKTQLQVFDGLGQLVRRQDIQITPGNNNYYFELKNLPAGTYNLRSTEPSLDLQKTFTIVR